MLTAAASLLPSLVLAVIVVILLGRNIGESAHRSPTTRYRHFVVNLPRGPRRQLLKTVRLPYSMDPYNGFMNPESSQHVNTRPYHGAAPPPNPYPTYPNQVTYPTARHGGDPRQWSQPLHPTSFQVPGLPVSANAGGPQWQPTLTEIEVDGPREKIRRTRTECRKRKQRCDGRRPCRQCMEQRIECQYRDPQPPTKQSGIDRAIQLAEENKLSLAMANNNLDTVYAEMGRVNRRLGVEVERRRAGTQIGDQGALYPTNT
ncbi:hypothetical protein M409DRAFT_61413 [Zasmidium cellare ATCC 36951]|uniref:Zn(2)-C6 fungal-type domain-containing protein n=1 Tax=Zasmidium cellare ATCC 36951 TaxID=1080233 RepID=A0A6A6BVK7_ZASCE|nr:uncharacterized protein M409DRAFT_61384 [Zasmidium cellare ATCC 36951]XP_033659645.1 uncharacterized protein M409DRAFT_61413 [Zasmidium cellare ATCC 36951]KAF2158725.1 hypothetical protein M409DRAFT_61384 [Zasmidium cellare ATCC 36951]KAF2158756.1 hypothetical protein M409DRAFT_61413 [Zasmidium cellare ATCC 36951]